MERASEEGNFHHCYSQVVHDTFPWALTMFSGRLRGEGIEPPPHPKQSWPLIHSFASYLLNACCVPGTNTDLRTKCLFSWSCWSSWMRLVLDSSHALRHTLPHTMDRDKGGEGHSVMRAHKGGTGGA